jgi:hypothetical protein
MVVVGVVVMLEAVVVVVAALVVQVRSFSGAFKT